MRCFSLIGVLVCVGSIFAQDKPEKPVGVPWPGGTWQKDGKEYPEGSFIWIKQADWDKYQTDLKTWEAKHPEDSEGKKALAEVNALRAQRGLPPYAYDEGLTKAAKSASSFRASHLIEFHTSNDFAFVPSGCSARAAGCAAWHPSMGWGSCCIYDHYQSAGAGWTLGSDGKRYMHLFVK